MKKKLIAVTLSLSILLLGGTAMATNAQSNQNENGAKIQSQTRYTSTASISAQESERESEGMQNNCSMDAAVQASANEQGQQDQAGATLTGTVTGLCEVNGSYAIQVEKKNGEAAVVKTNADTKLLYNGKELNSTLDINSNGQVNIAINQDGEAITVNFMSSKQASATMNNRAEKINRIDRIDPADKIDDIDKIDGIDIIDEIDRIDDLDKIVDYVKISRLDMNNLIDEMDELEELNELSEEFNEELNELDELDELNEAGKHVNLFTLA